MSNVKDETPHLINECIFSDSCFGEGTRQEQLYRLFSLKRSDGLTCNKNQVKSLGSSHSNQLPHIAHTQRTVHFTLWHSQDAALGIVQFAT